MPLRRSRAEPSSGIDPRGLGARRCAALLIGGVAAASAGAAVLHMPLDAQNSSGTQLAGFLLNGGVWLFSRKWRSRRRARLVWRTQVAGLYGFEPGLVARRSIAGWTEMIGAVVVPAVLTLMLLAWLPDEGWSRIARIAVASGVAVLVGRITYDLVRFTGALAITGDGIRQGRRRYEWSNVDHARLKREDGRVNGVYLRPREWTPTRQERVVGGRGVAVPDDRLLAAIDLYRTRPEMLAVGLPLTAPEPATAELVR